MLLLLRPGLLCPMRMLWAAACTGQLCLACLEGMQSGHLLAEQRHLSADQLLLRMGPSFCQLLQP